MKKQLAKLSFLIFSQILWSQPSGGGQNGPGSPGSHGNSGSSPQQSSSARSVIPDQNYSVQDFGQNPYSLPHRGPEHPGDDFHSPGPMPPDMDDGPAFIYYRGMRIVPCDLPLRIIGHRIMILKNGDLEISIRFNQSINPVSLKKRNIIVNGRICPENTDLIFNHKSDSLKIVLKFWKRDEQMLLPEIKILNLRTLDGKIAEETVIK